MNAVVLLSGGLDSATILALARSQGFTCHCLSLDYGQRHNAELKAAARVAASLGAAAQRTLQLDLATFGTAVPGPSRSPTFRPATPYFFPMHWLSPKSSMPAIFSSASMRSIIRVIRIVGRSTSGLLK